jgi:hypothetical protein
VILSHLFQNNSLLPNIWNGLVCGILIHLILDYINILTRFNYKWYSFLLFFFTFRMIFSFNRNSIDRLLRYQD